MKPISRAISHACLLALAMSVSAAARAGPDDGSWSDLSPLERAGYAAIHDPLRDRIVLFGGYHPGGATSPDNETWTLSLASGSHWTRQVTSGAPPAWSSNFTALHDPIRDRMLLVLGGGRFGVWALSLATMTWLPLTATGTAPIISYGATCVYDALRDRVLVFGGDVPCPHGPCPHNEVWSLSLAGTPAWSLLSVAGQAPAARFDHCAIFDPVRDRMVVFAGLGAYYVAMNDVWALDLSGPPAWSPIVASGTAPAPRQGYVAIYDPAGDRMLVSGASGGSTNDLWSLSLGGSPAWFRLAPSGSPPRDRWDVSLVYDAVRQRLLLHGGSLFSGGGAQTAGETWALGLAPAPTWSQLLAPPPGRAQTTAVLDAATERLVVFGGMMQLGGAPVSLNDVWVRELAGDGPWTVLNPAGPRPAPRWDHTAVMDDARHRMIVFGGVGATGYNDAWALSLGSVPTWSLVEPVGTPPPARDGQVAVYDPVGDRMVVFGGTGASFPQEIFSDTWALSFTPGPSWTKLAPAGSPPSPRFGMAAAFDSKRQRMLVFGGLPISGGGELWSLSLSGVPTWTQVIVPNSPPARAFSSAVYDPAGDRLIVFGGLSDSPGEGNAAWALALAGVPAWTRLSPAGGMPAQRLGFGAIFDAPRNRMLIFGGFTPGQGINTVLYDDLWALTWEPRPPTAVPPTPPKAAFGLLGAWPNPAAHRLSISFALADRGPAVLELLDVGGRRVLAREVGQLGTGAHTLELDREVAGLSTGVYLARLRQGTRVAGAKIFVVH